MVPLIRLAPVRPWLATHQPWSAHGRWPVMVQAEQYPAVDAARPRLSWRPLVQRPAPGATRTRARSHLLSVAVPPTQACFPANSLPLRWVLPCHGQPDQWRSPQDPRSQDRIDPPGGNQAPVTTGQSRNPASRNRWHRVLPHDSSRRCDNPADSTR